MPVIAVKLCLERCHQYARKMDVLEERTVAAQLYGRCWELLESPERSADEDAELLTSAFASRHHWLPVGGPEQWAVSDWMVARAAGAVGMGELAIRFAWRAHVAVLGEGGPDWLVASCVEGLARAYAVVGDVGERDRWLAEAARLTSLIVDDEDRTLIESQVATVPLGGPTAITTIRDQRFPN